LSGGDRASIGYSLLAINGFKNISNYSPGMRLRKIIQLITNIQIPMVTLKKNALLVDVRTEAEFAEAHVNGSTIPLDQLPNQLEKFKGKEQIIVFAEAEIAVVMPK
jgi:hypothetical protein